ncbi:MAG: tRNA (N6-threonylcarbamoyladenosine(37)-N6)-methyltransferase TrmO [Anaerolineae bacterium]
MIDRGKINPSSPTSNFKPPISNLQLHPIGYVVNDKEPGQRCIIWEEVISEIVVEPEWEEALEGLEGFSHLWVIFWLGHVSEGERRLLKVHPENRDDVPLMGIFATRTPTRPNPLGLTAVRLLARRGNVLKVQGLDAWHGTPILDLKPYLRQGDCIEDAITPPWLMRLWAEENGTQINADLR